MHPDLEKMVARGKIDSATADKIDLLPQGTHCIHKSWGIGKVNDWDRLAVKIIIDFEDKPEHAMAMKFAAGSVDPIPEDHFMARRYEDADTLAALAQDDPIELVKRALSSVGGTLSLDQFDDMVKGPIVPEGSYKRWWDTTKKKLRTDVRFVVPTKRNEPLELRAEGTTPAKAMVDDYHECRDLKGKAKAAEAILKDFNVFKEDPSQLLPVVEDMNDAARKGMRLQFQNAVELVVARDEVLSRAEGVELQAEKITIGVMLRENPEKVTELLQNLPLSRLRGVLKEFDEAYGDEWVERMMALIHDSSLRVISEVANFLFEKGQGDTLVDFLETGLQNRSLTSDALAWICRERKDKAAVIFDPALCLTVMSSLEQDQLQEEGGVRAANRLRDLMADDGGLIPDLIENADIHTTRNFAGRLMSASVFDDLTRKSLMARVVKLKPETSDLITGTGKTEDEPLIVSEASYTKRKKEYDHLSEKEIPENREEIKVARSYGDLRENFEYKAAKEQQRVLNKKKTDWEYELKLAKPTDFSSATTSEVSIGTIVELTSEDGGEDKTYTILGAWDTDTDEGILSYLSVVGREMLGKKPGENVNLPDSEGGDTKKRFVVKSITKWVK